MDPDPYQDLEGQMQARKRAYLLSLAARDVNARTAHSRGFLRVPGNRVNVDGKEERPRATPAEITAADTARDASQAFWEDTPALRVFQGDPFEFDHINDVMARMKAADLTSDSAQAIPFPPWFVVEGPGIDFPKVDEFCHARRVLGFTYRVGARVYMTNAKGDLGTVLVQDWIKQTIGAPEKFLSAGLVDRIRASFDRPPPGFDNPAPSQALIDRLARLTHEDEDNRIGSTRATRLLQPISVLLHAPAVLDGEGKVTNPGDPTLYADFEAELLAYANKLSEDLLSDEIDWPEETWNAVELLSWLGTLRTKTFGLALREIATRAPKPPEISLNETQLDELEAEPYRLPVLLMHPTVSLPASWQWPERNTLGLYWFRSIILHHIIEHVLSYKDTADFHITDLLRFAHLNHLFDDDRKDKRVPDYVAADVKLAILYFKYWFDEGPEYDREKMFKEGVKAEMTFWSENHMIQFCSSEFLAGQLFPYEDFPRHGDTVWNGSEHKDRARRRLVRWLDDRLRFGFSEWNAPGYYNEDLPPLFNLVDFARDSELIRKAQMVLDLLIYDMARFNSRGSFGTTAGRAYLSSKAYGWRQSVGNFIEILFGTRGDFTSGEVTAISFATSSYVVPHVFLAIGLDRVYDDCKEPMIDRTRSSITRDEAAGYNVGFKSDQDMTFWWSTGSYFTEETLEGTRRVVEKYDNLKTSPLFAMLYPSPDLPWYGAIIELLVTLAKTPIVGNAVEAGAGAGVAVAGRAGLLLPFPLNVASWGIAAAGTLMVLKGAFNFVADLFKTGVRVVEKIFGDDDDEPVFPESTIIKVLEELLKSFNVGTTLTRVNQVHYSNGDALLGSVQNHLKGKIAFQKSAWQATIDCEAAVWTGTPPSNMDCFLDYVPGLSPRAWLEFFKDLFQLQPTTAIAEHVLPYFNDVFGDDGPNYWTGEFALPMVVQHEGAAIIAYNIPNRPRAMHVTSTHAWFPKAMFDETRKRDVGDGTWLFGRKRDGFVALYSARRVDWKAEEPHRDKEVLAEGGSNIWICMIGNTERFKPPFRPPLNPAEAKAREDPEWERKAAFGNFVDEVASAYLSISGVGTWNQLQASFDMPRTKAPPGRTPRLELFYDDDVGKFAGEPLTLDYFPRFENKYGRAAWGARQYTIRHRLGLSLTHDHDAPDRRLVQQPVPKVPVAAGTGGPLKAARRSPRDRFVEYKRASFKEATKNA